MLKEKIKLREVFITYLSFNQLIYYNNEFKY